MEIASSCRTWVQGRFRVEPDGGILLADKVLTVGVRPRDRSSCHQHRSRRILDRMREETPPFVGVRILLAATGTNGKIDGLLMVE